ncbi:MAG: hypothetical protein JKY15_05120 [Deltaproteobacteria bacterium]|nr:hypothetical protein [Deltaproteobacteria bacterium]
MILLAIFLLPLIVAFLLPFLPRYSGLVSLASILVIAALTLSAYSIGESSSSLEDVWLMEFKRGWLYFALDGLSFVLLLTSQLLGALSLVTVWQNARQQMFLLLTLSGTIGLLLSIDLLAFFIFWEIMLLPTYFWVLSAGKEGKSFPVLQFIIFTQASGLLLLGSVVALLTLTGTTNLNQLLSIELSQAAELWIASGFIIAFLIKFPIFPFHVWMPSLFAESALGAIISGLLLKTGAYGFLRFVLPLFPKASMQLSSLMMFLGAASVLYGALLAFSQKNPAKVFAYSIISHAGLMLMGLFSDHQLALNGVIVLMVTQAIATAGFMMSLNKHLGFSLFFAMASLGLPGLGNFVGEWLLLFGLFQSYPQMAVLGSLSLILGAAYFLKMLTQIYYERREAMTSISRMRFSACLSIAVLLLWIGLFPADLLDLTTQVWREDISRGAS